jgi:serine protease Do
MSEEWDNRKNHTDTDHEENAKPENENAADSGAADQEGLDSHPAEETTESGSAESRSTAGNAASHKAAGEAGGFEKTSGAGGASSGNETPADGGTTYSWVNPKLRGGGADSGSADNPWNSRSGGNFWETQSSSEHSQNRYSNTQYGGMRDHTSQSGSYDNRTGSNLYQNSTQYQNSTYYQEHTQQGNPYQQNPYADPGPSGSRKNRRKAERAAKRAARKAGRSQTGAGTGRKWTTVVAMALVFGLIAGTVTYGVNAIANRIHPIETTAENNSSDATDSGNRGSGSKDSGSGNSGKDTISSTTEGTGSSDTSSSSSSVASSGASGAADGTVADVAANCMPSLVTISTMSVEEMQSFFGGSQKYQVQGAGSGVIIGQNDTELLIATNNHVVAGATSLSVGFIDETVVQAAIKGTDADNDLAVVAVQTSDIPEDTQKQLKVATIGSSDELALGDQIVAIGNALGYGQSVTAGYVSAKNRTLELSDGTNTFTSTDLIQIDAAINSGNSGGALFNMKGELVGINEAKSSSTSSGATVDNMGYAIPIDKAEPILEQLMTEETKIAYSEDEQGYLGITATNVTSEYSQMYDMPEGVGITSVVKGGPAEQGGLQKGDIIIKVAGTTVSNFDDLQNELRYHKSGESIEITYERADNGKYKENTANVTLGTKDVLSSINAQNNGNN